MAEPLPEPQVRNPYHWMLTNLRDSLARETPAIADALDKTAADMASGQVWIGSTAKAFALEVGWRQQRLKKLVSELMAIVNAELRSTPERVPASKARALANKNDW